jgi:hypothetical protein
MCHGNYSPCVIPECEQERERERERGVKTGGAPTGSNGARVRARNHQAARVAPVI